MEVPHDSFLYGYSGCIKYYRESGIAGGYHEFSLKERALAHSLSLDEPFPEQHITSIQ